MKNKIIIYLIGIILLLYIVMIVYYTILVYDFSRWGIFVSITLTILPTLVGIWFGMGLQNELKKIENESNKI